MATVELITRKVNVGLVNRKTNVGLSSRRVVIQVRPGVTINNGDVTYVGAVAAIFTQATPLLVWSVSHNLGRYPIIRLKNLGTGEIEGEINHLSVNQFTVTFNTPQAGQAIYI